MTVAIWIIAICEIIRDIGLVVSMVVRRAETRSLNAEFIKSLRKSDREWVRGLLEEFEREAPDGKDKSDN